MAGPGGRMMAGGAPTDRSMDFKGSSKRLLKRFGREKASLWLMLGAVAVSVALSVAGPKILGKATDLVFAGSSGGRWPARRRRRRSRGCGRTAGVDGRHAVGCGLHAG